MMFRIGIISDTHGLLRPEAERGLTGVDHIIHAGDIGRPEIVDALRRIAPVTAIRGNVDGGGWARDYPDTNLVRLAGKSIYVLRDLKTLKADPGAGIDVIVSGHSHVPKIDRVGGVLYLNPGSAGPRRFKLPITLATLELTPDGMRPEIHDLGVMFLPSVERCRPGSPLLNPTASAGASAKWRVYARRWRRASL